MEFRIDRLESPMLIAAMVNVDICHLDRLHRAARHLPTEIIVATLISAIMSPIMGANYGLNTSDFTQIDKCQRNLGMAYLRHKIELCSAHLTDE